MVKHKIAMPLLLMVTQERENIIYVAPKRKLAEYEDAALADKRPLKLIGHLYDLVSLIVYLIFIDNILLNKIYLHSFK